MTTVREIVTGSMKLLGVVFKSEAISADEGADGLARLNELLESWSNDSLLCYSRTWENFTLTANDGEYTIGTAQDFSTARPINIISAYVLEGTTSHPLEIINDAAYAAILDKSTAGMPTSLNYDYAMTGKIRLYPVPSAANVLYLQSEKLITSFTSLTDSVTLPPGWLRALRYNLAVDLAPEYGKQVTPDIYSGAVDSKALIKSAVLRNRPITFAQAAGQKYSILSDSFV